MCAGLGWAGAACGLRVAEGVMGSGERRKALGDGAVDSLGGFE